MSGRYDAVPEHDREKSCDVQSCGYVIFILSVT